MLPIAHIGVLVADLETAREHWAKATGFAFSPISRYRPTNWSDYGNPEPHLHDARLTFCLGVDPSIEILEFVGTGTHSPTKGEGGHHLSFPPIADNLARRREFTEIGVGVDGEIWHDGRCIFMFTDARALTNVYTEWVEESPAHADVKDDGSPANRLPDGSKTLFEPETILELDGVRPPSGISEIGVEVRDLDSACRAWTQITGATFDPIPADAARLGSARSAVSTGLLPPVRLVEHPGIAREGLSYAVIAVANVASEYERLVEADVPVTISPEAVEVDTDYLNGFGLRFIAIRD